MSETVSLLQNFKFHVALNRSDARTPNKTLGDGAFAECTGLQLEADIKEYLEGGRNDGVIRRVGRVKLVPLVLKRGMFVQPREGATAPTDPREGTAQTELWDWLSSMVGGGGVRRYDGVVTLFDATRTRPYAAWTFERGLPMKVLGPTLIAKTGDIAIEELHIAHEGLRLKAGG